MSRIKGTTRVCGLIGNPVEHSMSPFIHNNLAKLCGLDLAYVTFKVEADDVKEAIGGAYVLNVLGMNVTVPHKQAVIETLCDIDPLANAIGAVNTLVRTNDGYKGYNTDILGLHRELIDADISLKDSKVIILGAGGASRAIAFLCAREGASEVHILNRTVEKAQIIATDVNTHLNTKVADGMALADHVKLNGSEYIVIQTSSVGLYPHVDDVVIEDDSFYKKAKVGVDIIYNPAETKFMKCMKANGKEAYNGLKMLLYQAVSAFELWNDMHVDENVIQQVYQLMQEELTSHE